MSTPMESLLTHLEMLKSRVDMISVDSLIEDIKTSYIPLEQNIMSEEELSREAEKHADEYYKDLFPKNHPEFSDVECHRLKTTAIGCHYIGYKHGYKKAKNI